MKNIEIKDTEKPQEKRVIMYTSDSQSVGIKMDKVALYELYTQLREMFKDN